MNDAIALSPIFAGRRRSLRLASPTASSLGSQAILEWASGTWAMSPVRSITIYASAISTTS